MTGLNRLQQTITDRYILPIQGKYLYMLMCVCVFMKK